MHSLSLLENIAVALGAAFVEGLIFQRISLPTIVGYLLAGVAIGPFTPGYMGIRRPSASWPSWGSSF